MSRKRPSFRLCLIGGAFIEIKYTAWKALKVAIECEKMFVFCHSINIGHSLLQSKAIPRPLLAIRFACISSSQSGPARYIDFERKTETVDSLTKVHKTKLYNGHKWSYSFSWRELTGTIVELLGLIHTELTSDLPKTNE